MIAIVDGRMPHTAIEELRRLGHEVIPLPPAKGLPAPVASHPDMLFFPAEREILCTKGYFATAKEQLLKISHRADRPIRCIDEEYGEEYPADVPLNALSLGGYLFHHPSATARVLREGTSCVPVPVRQGYVKCATLPVGNHAMISADPSILAAARGVGIDTLAICPDHIRLEGYPYGFIGGCASASPYAETDTVYFCGDVQKHPMGKEIADFCQLHGKEIHALCALPLTDVGTIFLI